MYILCFYYTTRRREKSGRMHAGSLVLYNNKNDCHSFQSAEGEDDEETLSADPCGSPVRLIKNDLSPQTFPGTGPLRDAAQASTSQAVDFYGLNIQQTKDTFYKDIPSSSKNFNIESDVKNKCSKVDSQYISDLDSLNLQSKSSKSKNKKNETLNSGSRRYSDSSAQKSNLNSQANVSGSRFTTTLVSEDLLKPTTSGESKSNNNVTHLSSLKPTVTRANNVTVKPGFTVPDD